MINPGNRKTYGLYAHFMSNKKDTHYKIQYYQAGNIRKAWKRCNFEKGINHGKYTYIFAISRLVTRSSGKRIFTRWYTLLLDLVTKSYFQLK